MANRHNLTETIANEPTFSTFSQLMKLSGSNELFSRPGEFTVFVPTNEAFARIPEEKMNAMLNELGQEELKALLQYHIVPGKIMASSIGAKQIRSSVGGEQIDFADYKGIKVNGAPVQSRNIEATNGVVHSLGTVLSPQPLEGPVPADATATPGMPPIPPAGSNILQYQPRPSAAIRQDPTAATSTAAAPLPWRATD